MKTKLLFLLVLIVLCSGMAFSQTEARVIATNANIRDVAGQNGKVKATVKKGTKLKVLSEDNTDGWYNVSYGKIKGWIHGNAIELKQQPVSAFRSTANVWIHFASGDDAHYFYDYGQMIQKGFGFRVWVKSVFIENKETASMMQYDVKCDTNQYRRIAGVSYYADGSIKFSQNKPQVDYQIIIPETILASLAEEGCKKIR
jgi:uncharacterized protein YgiM (DUF1202 family)